MAIQEQANIREAKVARRVSHASDEKKVTVGSVLRYIAVAIIVFISLAPLYWTFTTSIKSGLEVTASPPTLFPHSFDLSTYATVLLNSPFFLLDLRNSAIVAAITTILSLLIGILCAYAIARTNFVGKGAVLAIILSVNMFPFIAMVGPLFVIFTGPIYIYNTYAALIIPDLILTLPLTIWFMTSFFRDLPPDLEEAARMDGASRLQALWYVIVPLTAPGVFAAAILSFIAVWNDFLFGLTMTTDENAQPITVGITRFNSEHLIAYGQLAAGAIIVTIPLVILVLVLQRRIVAGLTAGAVKG
ncbi:ABC transporter permease [Reticulibacter mediterranei]|uniref:ABC transporter permease n=1 Tax=Reticulibacter mediterranei TaxID=2778369 RepID=A0A8J3ILL0_9CHLR|nr:carbohydrate ABC transporter permease [Reticulibacter mediterranei]GHO92940.1 ABC transporter permease [Reticulibacter mediterranei]